MNELARMKDQLERSFAGEAWHGPAVLEVLEGVTAAQAAERPLPGAHGIWELVLHLTGTYRVVVRRMRGDGSPMQPEEDWPPLPEASETAWAASLQELRTAHGELQGELARRTDADLERPVVQGASSLYVTLCGMAQHNTYHAGQIALLRKAFARATG